MQQPPDTYDFGAIEMRLLQLRCAVSLKYTLDFRHYKKKNKM